MVSVSSRWVITLANELTGTALGQYKHFPPATVYFLWLVERARAGLSNGMWPVARLVPSQLVNGSVQHLKQRSPVLVQRLRCHPQETASLMYVHQATHLAPSFAHSPVTGTSLHFHFPLPTFSAWLHLLQRCLSIAFACPFELCYSCHHCGHYHRTA